MIEWFIQLVPELQAAWLSAFAAAVATVIATAALLAQWRSQRRQDRLALFEARLQVYQGAMEAGRVGYHSGFRLTFPWMIREVREQLPQALALSYEIRYRAAFLFGPEVSEHLRGLGKSLAQLNVVVTHIASDTSDGELFHEEAYASYFAEVDGLLKSMGQALERTDAVFAPYLEKDRMLGLSWWDRVMLRPTDDSKRDPLLRPSPPLNVPRST